MNITIKDDPILNLKYNPQVLSDYSISYQLPIYNRQYVYNFSIP